MTIAGVTIADYRKFLNEGGQITFEIDAEDIERDKKFENIPQIKSLLSTGFELPPTSIIDDSRAVVQIWTYGEPWTIVLTDVYRKRGKIIYKRLISGKYQAECSIPPVNLAVNKLPAC